MKLVLAFTLVLLGSCTTHISREGEYLTLLCTFPCFLRIAKGDATIMGRGVIQIKPKAPPPE